MKAYFSSALIYFPCNKEFKQAGLHFEYVILNNVPFLHIERKSDKMGKTHRKKKK